MKRREMTATKPRTYRKARDEAVARELLTSQSIAEASRRVGVPENTLKTKSWYQRIHTVIRPITLAHLARAGLTLPRVARKHSDLMDASKTVGLKVSGAENGEALERVEVPDNDIQLRAMEDYYKILGPLHRLASDMPAEGEMGNTINVNIGVPEKRAQPAGSVKGRRVSIKIDT